MMAEGEILGMMRQITAGVRRWIPNPRRWWKSLDRTSRQILMVLFGVAVVLSVPAAVLSGDWSGLLLNLGTELAGGAVTFILLEEILGGRKRKAELIREMGSPDNGIALRAVNELSAHGWLTDGSLRKVNLPLADLRGASFWTADLQEAFLLGAKLQRTPMFRANLQKADLSLANLQEAILAGANLKGAIMWDANLELAELVAGVYMGMKDNPETWEAEFDETTILPDGTNWTPDTDMERFTDPKHSDFWRSDNPDSPAYRGKAGVDFVEFPD